MTRTTRYKVEYGVVLLIGLLLAGFIVWSLGEFSLTAGAVCIGLGALLLVPGRLSGFLWRDLYRGRRLFNAGEIRASIDASRRFLELLAERPRLRRLWWLAWAVYSRDPKAMALNNVGAAQMHLGRLDEAETTLHEALAVDAEYPLPHFNLAVLHYVRGEREESDRHARRAVDLGFSQDAVDRLADVAGGVLARIEGRGDAATSG